MRWKWLEKLWIRCKFLSYVQSLKINKFENNSFRQYFSKENFLICTESDKGKFTWKDGLRVYLFEWIKWVWTIFCFMELNSARVSSVVFSGKNCSSSSICQPFGTGKVFGYPICKIRYSGIIQSSYVHVLFYLHQLGTKGFGNCELKIVSLTENDRCKIS